MGIKIYVANLGKYNEGILKGEWFTLPADMDSIAEAIGLNDQYEEYAIHDYEAPFEIKEYDSIESLNEIAELMEDKTDYEISAAAALLHHNIVSTFKDALEALGEVIWYYDCYDMSDVAYEHYAQTTGIPDGPLADYIDWYRVGRDMDIAGTYIKVTDDAYIQYIG